MPWIPAHVTSVRVRPCSFEVGECVCASHFSRVQFFATLWTAARQVPLSVHWILQARTLEWVAPGIKPASPALKADSLPLSYWGSPSEVGDSV